MHFRYYPQVTFSAFYGNIAQTMVHFQQILTQQTLLQFFRKADIRNPLRYLLMNAVASRPVVQIKLLPRGHTHYRVTACLLSEAKILFHNTSPFYSILFKIKIDFVLFFFRIMLYTQRKTFSKILCILTGEHNYVHETILRQNTGAQISRSFYKDRLS